MYDVNYNVFIATDFVEMRKRRPCVFHSALFLGAVQFCVTVRVIVILYVFILEC